MNGLTISLFFPPGFDVVIDMRSRPWIGIVKDRTEATERPVVKSVKQVSISDPKMPLPPKVLIVERVILVQLDEIFRQMTDRWKVQRIDERMRWSRSCVIVMRVHHDWDDVVTQRVKKPAILSSSQSNSPRKKMM